MSGTSRNPFLEVREKNEYKARNPVLRGSAPRMPDIAKLVVNARNILDHRLVTELSKAGNVESLHDLMSTRAEARRLCAVLAHAHVAKDDETATMTWQDASVEFAFLLGFEDENREHSSPHNHIAAEMLRACIPDFTDAALRAIVHSSNLCTPWILELVRCESGRRRTLARK